MYGGIHRGNNTNANLNVSRPVRSTYFWALGRDAKHMHKVDDKSDKCSKSSLSYQSDKPDECGSPSDCLGCWPFSCARLDPSSNYYIGDKDGNKDRTEDYRDKDGECPKCHCFNCNCGASTSIDPERERSSTGIWIGNELRDNQHTSSDATDSIEYITGIPTGATV